MAVALRAHKRLQPILPLERELTSPQDIEAAAMAQYVVASYALGYRQRQELADQFCFSVRTIQAILSHQSHKRYTEGLRGRLAAHGIEVTRNSRGQREAIRRALESLAERVQPMLLRPHLYSEIERRQAAQDLYLLSGAWL